MAKAAAAPLDASLLGVAKGAAAPPPDPGPAALVPSPTPSAPPERAPLQARRREPEVAPLPVEEPRTALTVRLPLSTQERLREASFRLRREKQSIVDEAVQAWLADRGY